MKSGRLRNITLFLTLVLTLVLLAGCFGWGSPNIDIIIENQTNQVLSISFLGGPYSDNVSPGQQITRDAPLDAAKYPISAKNLKGEVVFSETYTFYPDDKYHLEETDLKHEGVVKVYKAVIPPLQSDPTTTLGLIAHPVYDVLLENQTDQILNVFHSGYLLGHVEPGKAIKTAWDTHSAYIEISAISLTGDFFFSQHYSSWNLQKIDERTYKGVIPSSPSTPTTPAFRLPDAAGSFHISNLVIENQTDQTLIICLDDQTIGTGDPICKVGPGKTTTIQIDEPDKTNPNKERYRFKVEAINVQGEMVFEQMYIYDPYNDRYTRPLQKIDDKTYKLVIPPLQSK